MIPSPMLKYRAKRFSECAPIFRDKILSLFQTIEFFIATFYR